MNLKTPALNAAYLLAILASFWRNRWWHVALHTSLTVLIIERPSLLAAPLWLFAICAVGLAAARRRPGHRVPILRSAIALLCLCWLALKVPQARGWIARAALPADVTLPFVPGLSFLFVKLVGLCVDAMAARSPLPRPSSLWAMAAFAPTYQAGPMHRFEEFEGSFSRLPAARERDWSGAVRKICWGLFEFAVLSAHLGAFCLPILAAPAEHTPGQLLLALYAYSLYIYFNFAGTSDLAIGVGRAFGIETPENFAHPYLKNNLQAFWQSWHITFTRWLQACIFMPLSKRLMRTRLRKHPQRIAWVAYVATFLFCGLWHGEGANFLVWGLWHGLGMCVYTSLPRRLRAPVGDAGASPGWRWAIWWALTFTFVSLGWVFFACPIPQATNALQRLLGLG